MQQVTPDSKNLHSRKRLAITSSFDFRGQRLPDLPSRPRLSLPTRIKPKRQDIDKHRDTRQRQPRRDKDPEISSHRKTSRLGIEDEEVHAIWDYVFVCQLLCVTAFVGME